jgi:hypothetical protein
MVAAIKETTRWWSLLVVVAVLALGFGVVFSSSGLGGDTRPVEAAGDGDAPTPVAPLSISLGDEDYAMQFTRAGNGDAVGSTYATAPATGFGSVTSDVTLMAWVNRGTLAAGRAMGVVSLGPSGIFANGTTEWAFRIAIYVNGQQVSPTRIGSNTAGTGTLDSGGLLVGKFPSWDSLNARIDEVRLFNDVRTQSEVEADMHTYGPTNTDNLVAYYDFNEGPAGTTGSGTV